MKPPFWFGPFAALILVLAGELRESRGAITSVATQDDGNKTDLVSVTDGGVTYTPTQGLIGVQVFGWNVTSATSGTSTTVISPDAASSIPAGSRANLLQNDVALNTGLLNPGGSSVLALGASPMPATSNESGTNGLGLTFDVPIVNQLGDSVILFDFSLSSRTAPDPFEITALGNGVGYAAHSLGSASYVSGDYQASGAVSSATVYSQPNPMSSVSLLESQPLTTISTFMTPEFHAIGINLSSLGVPLGAEVTGLWIESTSLHPVYIAGLSVPEPSAWSLLMLGAGTFLLGGIRNLVQRESSPPA